jgi:acyl carrier protein
VTRFYLTAGFCREAPHGPERQVVRTKAPSVWERLPAPIGRGPATAGLPSKKNRNQIPDPERSAMPAYHEILHQVTELIRPLAPPNRPVEADTDLVADLEFDSLKVMSLIEQVEDRFDISIPLNILPDIRTVKDFTIQLQRLLEGSPS